jgi:hypothetical protein
MFALRLVKQTYDDGSTQVEVQEGMTPEAARNARMELAAQLKSMAQDVMGDYVSGIREDARARREAVETAVEPEDKRMRFRFRAGIRLNALKKADIRQGMSGVLAGVRHRSRIRQLEHCCIVSGILPKIVKTVRAHLGLKRMCKQTDSLEAPKKASHRLRRNNGKHLHRDALNVLAGLPVRHGYEGKPMTMRVAIRVAVRVRSTALIGPVLTRMDGVQKGLSQHYEAGKKALSMLIEELTGSVRRSDAEIKRSLAALMCNDHD